MEEVPGGGSIISLANICTHCGGTIIQVHQPVKVLIGARVVTQGFDEEVWVHCNKPVNRVGQWPKRCSGYPNEDEATPTE